MKVVFRLYPEFPEGAKLPLPLDIPVLKSFKLQGDLIPLTLGPWTDPAGGSAPDPHYIGAIYHSVPIVALHLVAQYILTHI